MRGPSGASAAPPPAASEARAFSRASALRPSSGRMPVPSAPVTVLLITAPMLSVGLSACSRATPPPTPVSARPDATPTPGPTGNRAPRAISARIQPENARTDQELRVTAEAVDADSDMVTWQYQWYLNGEKLLGAIGETFPASKTQHGDRLEVEVIPFDGRVQGAILKSGVVTIQNTPPVLLNEPPPDAALDGFKLQVQDADDDPITFRLEGQPPGMSIDPDGTFRWPKSGIEQPGDYQVSITASDGHDGTIAMKLSLSISQTVRPAKAPASVPSRPPQASPSPEGGTP